MSNYIHIFMNTNEYMHKWLQQLLMNKKDHELEERARGYVGGFGGKGEMM